MAGALTRAAAVIWLLTVGLVAAVSAQALPDPTRPPSGMPGSAPGAPWEVKTETASGPLLQSVILRKGSAPRALLNGEWYRQGQAFGDSKIVKILADRVLIKGPQGHETLKMMPDVDMRAVAGPRAGGLPQGKNK